MPTLPGKNAAKAKKKPPSIAAASEVRREQARSTDQQDDGDRERRGQHDRVREQSVLRVDRGQEDESGAEDCADERPRAEAEGGEAPGERRDAGGDDENAQAAGRQEFRERRARRRAARSPAPAPASPALGPAV